MKAVNLTMIFVIMRFPVSHLPLLGSVLSILCQVSDTLYQLQGNIFKAVKRLMGTISNRCFSQI